MTDPIITPAQMTTTDEHLLALAKIICTSMTGPSDFGWADQSDQYRAKCMDAALRAIVAEQQAIRDRALDDAARAASDRATYWRDEATAADDAGRRKLSLIYEAKAIASIETAAAIRAMKGKPGA